MGWKELFGAKSECIDKGEVEIQFNPESPSREANLTLFKSADKHGKDSKKMKTATTRELSDVRGGTPSKEH